MTDFRALCVELTDCLEKADWPHRYKHVFEQWIYIARKALAEPEPQNLKEQALQELERTVTLLMPVTGHNKVKRLAIIRRALESLPD